MTKEEMLKGYTGPDIGRPMKAIRAKCLDCSDGQAEVARCLVTGCPLFPFRMGKNPYRAAKVLSEEQREAMRVRFAKAKEAGKPTDEFFDEDELDLKPGKVWCADEDEAEDDE